jgi:methylated-DNA-protein-cysteine methyltransferase related protein
MPEKKPNLNFFDRVFAVARKIPKGRVTSYGAIAEFCGTGMSSRMVGWAMNASGSAKPLVPAHRVVNRNGLLTGKHHFATPTLMQELLENENIIVENDKVMDFNRLFWDPAKHIKTKKSKVKSQKLGKRSK